MWRYYILFIFLFPLVLMAQPVPAYTWIQPGQTYIRLALVQEGIYRVTAQELASGGYPGNIPAQQIKLYHRGIEQAIHLEDINVNTIFDGNDYLEFYGNRNDGGDDAQMYMNPVTGTFDTEQQPNPHMSIYSDTAVYFVTWSNTPGKRLSAYFNNTYSSYTPEPFFRTRTLLNLHISNWFAGAPGALYADNSEFVTGEGYYDLFPLAYGSPRTHIIIHPGAYPLSQGNWQMEVRALGYSIFSHVIDFQFGNFPVFTGRSDSIRLSTYTFSGAMGNLSGTQSSLTSTARYFPTDNNYLSWIRLRYDRSFALGGIDSVYISEGIYTQNRYWKFTQMNVNATHTGLVYDLSQNTRIIGTAGQNQMEVIIPGSPVERNFYVSHSGAVKSPLVSPARIRNLHTFQGAEYILVTHRSLSGSAQQMANVRQNSIRNPASVVLVYTDEIYDEFGYGSPTPLALYRFFRMARANWAVKPQYILLWGKGMTEIIRRNTREPFTENKVPVLGYPPSDWMYVSGYNPGVDRAIPEVSIGRVNIYSDAEGQAYIQKIQQYEQSPWDGTWMKEAIHLGGGENQSEQSSIRSYLQGRFQTLWEGFPNGGKVLYQQKSNTPINTTTPQEIRDRINDGVGLISFFGHSTSNIFDIEIREANEYNNYGKYPIILANGCYAGNFSSINKSFSERFVLEPGKGCIAYISSSGQGYITPLGELTSRFYETAFRDSIGIALGKQQMEAAKRFLQFACINPVACQSARNHVLQTNLQGDPALRLNFTQQPDFQINSASLRFNPDPFSSRDSFTIEVSTRNLGKAIPDSVPLKVMQQIQSGPLQGETYMLGTKNYPPVLYSDTLKFPVGFRDERIAGLNQFSFWIDSLRILNDANYTDNYVSIPRIIQGNNPAILYPTDFAIVPNGQISLSASAFSMSVQNNLMYEFHIDTSWTFDSPAFTGSGKVSGSACYAQWQLPFSLNEGHIYYWRVRLPDETQGSWSYASFRYQAGKTGWAQADLPQYRNNIFDGLSPNLSTRSWKFDSIQADVNIITATGGNARFNYNGIKVSNNDNQPTVVNGIWFSHISAGTLSIQTQDPLYGGWKWYAMPGDISALAQAIQQVPNGDLVILCSQFNPGIGNWSNYPEGENLYQAIESLGAMYIRQIPDANPYILSGRKGGSTGTAIEIFQPNVGIQYVLQTTLSSESSHGRMYSRYIGPAGQWFQSHYTWQGSPATDSVLYDLYAVRKDGTDSLLTHLSQVSAGTYNLTALPAQTYPRLRLGLYASDHTNRTAPEIQSWEVSHILAPDAVLDPARNFSFHSNPSIEGKDIKLQIAVSNYTQIPMDSLKIKFAVIRENNTSVILGERKYAPLAPHSFILPEFEFNTSGMAGKNTLIIEINPGQEQTELYSFNNFFYYPFLISGDNVNPVMDVTFDGRHIQDGEIVSPKPEIVISSKDNNPVFAMDSIGLFRISYRTYSGQDSPVQMINNAQIQFEPGVLPQNKARLIYKPGTMQDGEYTLRVQSQDRMGNLSGETPYEIRFRVINENTLTPIFNYPNPFSTRTKFVFTLTGADIPVTFRIDIFTITGRLIRRMDLREWGNLHIGQNLNGLEWDGTDDYGDRLANGVYLYKAHVKYADGSSPRTRDENGLAHFFNNGFGKLVIMR